MKKILLAILVFISLSVSAQRQHEPQPGDEVLVSEEFKTAAVEADWPGLYEFMTWYLTFQKIPHCHFIVTGTVMTPRGLKPVLKWVCPGDLNKEQMVK